MSTRMLICCITRRHYATMRYFPNEYADYNSGAIDFKEDYLKNTISEIVSSILKNFKATDYNSYGGLYTGTAGIAYMFYHLSKISTLKCERDSYLNRALDYIKPALKLARKHERKSNELTAFILGNCGIYAVASVIYHANKNLKLSNLFREKYLGVAQICKYQFLDCGDNELFVGRSGYLSGALWMANRTGTILHLKDLHDISHAIVSCGRNYSEEHKKRSPLMFSYYDIEYLGAAHGLSSILQSLMNVPDYLKMDTKAAKDIKDSINYLLSLQTMEGNFPCTEKAPNILKCNNYELVHWCHGAPGIIYAIARAYIIWKDEKFLKSCIKCGELVWEKGLLRKGSGLCHGIAGNGYVFLLLYRLTNDLKYLHRANVFAQFMSTDEFKRNTRASDNPYSLYEGIAGAACFLSDLMQPNTAIFPFNNVFN